MSLRSACLAAAFLFAASADANWLGTEPYSITIVDSLGFPEEVDADEVEVQDDVIGVFIGDADSTPVAGEVTVVAEGSGNDRKVIGAWSIDYGTGNVQSVIGTGGPLRVGAGTSAGSLPGVLNILGSDLEASVIVSKGTANVAAGSNVRDVELLADGSAYVTQSQLGLITTPSSDSYALLQESIVSTTGGCNQRATMIFEDSLLHCGSSRIEFGGDVEFHPALAQNSRLEIDGALDVNTASLRVINTLVETGSIFVANDGADLDIQASDWENAGGLRIASGAVGTTEMTVSSGSRYHDGGTARISGVGSAPHLTVTGAGTEFELDGDLRIGEYTIGNNAFPYFGNATVANGATVIVHGELAVRPDGVLDIESGSTVYAASVANEGTINENGGTLVLPEADTTIAALTVIASIAALEKRSDRARSSG
jgi:hypothetical protein